MSLLTKTPKAHKLSYRSNDLLDVFTSTKESLEGINHEIDNEHSNVDQQIEALQAHKDLLTTTKTRNTTVIANINKILE